MNLKKLKRKAWLIKLLHWEYWSFNAVYLPIMWHWFYLALRARSFFFFNAANPTRLSHCGLNTQAGQTIGQVQPGLVLVWSSIAVFLAKGFQTNLTLTGKSINPFGRVIG